MISHIRPNRRTPRGKARCLLLGVTGGIATGKSTVARMLEELGAPTIDFDHLSRLVVQPGKPAWKELIDEFGREILLSDQTLDRKRIRTLVFSDARKRKKLEKILHPKILGEYRTQLQNLMTQHPNGIIQVVVPLLFEAKLQSWFDKILLVYAPEEMQIQRLMGRDQTSRTDALQIIRTQMPIEEKRRYADFIIDNSGPPEETRRQVEAVWEKLKKIKKTADRGPRSA